MILDRETFFNRINDLVGTNTDDTSMSFIEDMTDTYNSLEEASQQANTSNDEWEKRYKELDASWREKYKSRFFSSVGRTSVPPQREVPEKVINAETISIEDLFN